jgi:hypothetical protein
MVNFSAKYFVVVEGFNGQEIEERDDKLSKRRSKLGLGLLG